MADDARFYKYKDAQGHEVLTNDPALVPPGTHVEEVNPRAPVLVEPAAPAPTIPDVIGHVHLPSALLGAAVVAAAVVVRWGFRRGRWLMRLAILLFAVAALGGLYFGWVMRSAGLGDDLLAGPGRALEEARAVRDQANATTRAQQEALKRIDEGR